MLNRIAHCKFISKILLASFLFVNFQSMSFGSIVSTEELISSQSEMLNKQRIIAILDSRQMRAKLESLGVSPELAKQRVNAMTNEELNTMISDFETLPTGGDFLGSLVLVFLVLLATDILGYTDIFPFVKRTVHHKAVSPH